VQQPANTTCIGGFENYLQTMSGINRAAFDSLRRAVELYQAGNFD
jgi:hypothetical protein